MDEMIDGIFLDTNVFEGAQFSYVGNNLEKLFKFCNDYEIPIYINEIVKREVERRVLLKSEDVVNDLKKDKLTYLARIYHISDKRDEIKDQLVTVMKNDFQNLIDDGTLSFIPMELDINKLVNMYFDGRAPFQNEKKKNEFPDALIVLSVNEFIMNTGKNIAIISNDNEVLQCCADNKIESVSHISKILHELNMQHNLSYMFNHHKSMIEQNIKEAIEDAHIEFNFFGYVYDDDVYADEILIDNIEIKNIYLLSEDNDNKMINIACEVTINFTLTTDWYSDYDTAMYDKEDGVWFSFRRKNTTFSMQEDLELTFEIDMNTFDDEPSESMMYTGSSFEIQFDLYNLPDGSIKNEEYSDE